MSVPSKTERLLMTAELHVEAARDMTAEHRFADAFGQWVKAAELFAEAGAVEQEQDAALRGALLAERVGDLARAIELLQRATELARAPGFEAALGQALAHLSRVAITSGRVADGLAFAHEAMDLGERIDDARLVGSVALSIGEVEGGRGAFDEAERALERGREAWASIHDEEGLGQVANARGELARARGDLAGAGTLFQAAVNHFMTARSPGGLSLAMANQGNLARVQGDLKGAATLFDVSLNMAQTSQDGPAIARAYTNLGNLAAMQGDLAAARSRYERALAIDKRWGQVRAVAGGLVNLASIAATEGRLEAALKSYGEALELLRPLRAARTTADLLAMMGQLEGRLGRLSDAERRFTEARDLAAKAGHHLGEARLAVSQAALLHARGQVEAALQGYRQAVPRLEAVGGASDLAVLWLVVADATLAAGDPSGARAAVEAAATRIDDSDAREAIDVRVARARVRLATEPDLDARAELVAAAQAQADAGRTSDAMASRLAVVDLGLDPVADRALAEQLVPEAEALGLAPLRIDARSALLGLAGGDPREGEELVREADGLGLGLLALRVRRRLAVALDLVGRHDEATRVREAAAKSARAWGAKAELARLEARR